MCYFKLQGAQYAITEEMKNLTRFYVLQAVSIEYMHGVIGQSTMQGNKVTCC
jgi:prephenate dehydratase